MTGTSVGLSVQTGTPPRFKDVSPTNPLPVSMGSGSAGSSSATPSYGVGATTAPTASSLAVLNSNTAAFDALNYQSVTVQVSGTFVGTIAFQVSNNNADWVTKGLTSTITNTVATSTTSTGGIWFGDIGARYFRAVMTAYTSGTGIVTLVYDALSLAPAAAPNTVGLTAGSQNIGITSPVTPSAYSGVTAASVNASVVKATAGSLFEMTVSNVTAATIYVKLYNKATAPTVGTDVPLATIPVAAGAYVPVTFAALGKRFSAGIALATTAGAAATDTAAVTAGAQISASFI